MTITRSKSFSTDSLGKRTLLWLFLFSPVLDAGFCTEAPFRFESFSGETVSVDRQPLFIISSHSANDLNEAMRCANLVNAQQGTFWVINLAWKQSSEIKRRIASNLLKEDFMRTRSTVLSPEHETAARMALIEPSGEVHWSCESFPDEEEWARAIWSRLSKTPWQKSQYKGTD